MMSAIDLRRAHRAAAHYAEPLAVIAADIAMIPGKDHITALVAPLAEQIGIPFGQGKGDGSTSGLWVGPSTQRGEQLALNGIKGRPRLGIDGDVEPALADVGRSLLPVDLCGRDVVLVLGNGIRPIFQDEKACIVEKSANIGDADVGIGTVVRQDAHINCIAGLGRRIRSRVHAPQYLVTYLIGPAEII